MDPETRAAIRKLETEIQEIKDERSRREKQALVWGIMFLGSIVVGMGGYLWAYVIQPALDTVGAIKGGPTP